MDDPEWVKKVQRYIFKTLEPIISDSDKRKEYVTPKYMAIWKKVFTHESYDHVNNYDALEFLGDRALEYAFSKYLFRLYPDLTSADYTNIKSAQMSKGVQDELFMNMKGASLIRTSPDVHFKSSNGRDVLEAFFGALSIISDDIVDGLGAINCYNFIHYLYRDITIETDVNKVMAPKTQVEQFFTRFGIARPIPIFIVPGQNFEVNIIKTKGGKAPVSGEILASERGSEEDKILTKAYASAINKLSEINFLTVERNDLSTEVEDDIIKGYLTLNSEQLEFLEQNGVHIENPTVGYAEGYTTKEVDSNVFADALKIFASYGVTTNWATELRTYYDFHDNPGIAKYAEKAYERLAREGFESMFFDKPSKTTTKLTITLQLIGKRADGSTQILDSYTAKSSISINEIKAKLVQKYAMGK